MNSVETGQKYLGGALRPRLRMPSNIPHALNCAYVDMSGAHNATLAE